MPYNTQLPKMVLREYGRHIQYLVEYAAKMEDDVARNKMVQDIIDLMGIINPTLRNVEDFRHKLWDHIFLISDFKLKADSPYPIPERETLIRRNIKLPYPKQKIRYAHYGKNIENCVNKAVAMQDDQMKQEFAQVIGNYMKMVYMNWNRDNVHDEQIKNDLLSLSKNQLVLEADSNLDTLTNSTRRPQNTQGQKQRFQQNQGTRTFKRFNPNQNQNRNFKKNR